MPVENLSSLQKEIAPLTLDEKRIQLARIVRGELKMAGGVPVTGERILEAIRIDNELAGHGAKSRAKHALAEFLERFTEGDLQTATAFLQSQRC